jgi:hypothetical protein
MKGWDMGFGVRGLMGLDDLSTLHFSLSLFAKILLQPCMALSQSSP